MANKYSEWITGVYGDDSTRNGQDFSDYIKEVLKNASTPDFNGFKFNLKIKCRCVRCDYYSCPIEDGVLVPHCMVGKSVVSSDADRPCDHYKGVV